MANFCYEKTDRLLRDLIDDLSSILSTDESGEVLHFVEYGEYGLALETLCFVITDRDIQISNEQRQQILNLQNLMQIESLPFKGS